MMVSHSDLWEKVIDRKPAYFGKKRTITTSTRDFSTIPLWLPSSNGGFGDIMNIVKLASGLQDEFPDKKVKVYFGKKGDLRKAQDLLQNESDPRIAMVAVTKTEMAEITRRSAVAIYFPIVVPDAERTYDQRILLNASINIYLPEYDSLISGIGTLDFIAFSRKIARNRVLIDESGQQHLILPTGFHSRGIGIHIDRKLVGLEQRADSALKKEVLDRAGFAWVRQYVPEVEKSEWGFTYDYDIGLLQGASYSINPLSILKYYLGFLENSNRDRSITIFDFSPSYDQIVPMDCYRRIEPFEHIYPDRSKFEGVKTVNGVAHYPNVSVVHVGPQRHSTFRDFLRYSQLPVSITGDLSLAEAISLDKPFMYSAPSWKMNVPLNLLNYVSENSSNGLLGEEEIRHIKSIFGCYRNFNTLAGLFYDPSTQEAFHRLNQSLITNHDLSKNLASIIREAVEML